MKLKIIYLLIFCNLFYSSLFGQFTNNFKNIKFKHLSLTEGLSQSSVLCILQDHNGFMWFGTRDGLNKFDGYSFKNYRYNSQDSFSLSNSFIRCIYEDEDNNLWIGTNNGLNKYVSSKDCFVRFSLSASNNLKESTKEIWSIISNGKSQLILGTGLGLKMFDVSEGKISSLDIVDKTKNTINTKIITNLLRTSDNNLWICTTSGVYEFNFKKRYKKFYSYLKNKNRWESIESPILYEDNQKKIWLGFKGGLAFFNKENNSFNFFETKSTSKIKSEVRTIQQGALGNLWVGTYNGIYVVNKDKSAITTVIHDENDYNSLSQNSIFKIIEDNKGDLWVGTYSGGINYYDRSYDFFKNISTGTNNSKLNYKVVSSIVEDSNENLWIGTEGGGINYFNSKTGLFNYYTHNSNDANSISSDNIKSIIKTKEGNLWIGTHDGGLNFLKTNELPFKFIKYTSKSSDIRGLSSNRIISLFEDYLGNIWIGTSGGGLNQYEKKTHSINRIPDNKKYIGNIIYSISKTSNENVLLFSGNKGLAKINILTKQISPIHYKLKKDSYNTCATLYTYEDKNKNIWIGTEGDALYFYNTAGHKSIKYGLPQGLPNEVVYGIIPDRNTIWISTNFGLSRFNLLTKEFKNFDVSDGLLSNEFNYGSFAKLKNGNLIFGGQNGINFFNPNSLIENKFIPSVHITSIYVNNKPYDFDENRDRAIELKYSQNDFSFDFVGLSFSKSNKNKYSYKLDGFDDDWKYAGNNRTATYTNIDEGSYTFMVKASNNDGVWNNKGELIRIKILPAPWRTWWAYVIYFLIVTTSLFYIRKYSLLRLHEKNELRLERQEKEKIKEINKMKIQMFTNISHDFRTPLTLVLGPLQRMISQRMGDDYIQEQLESMYRNANVLLQLINQLLDFRKSESGKLVLKASKNNIVPFVENIKKSFDELANTKQIDYSFTTSDDTIEVWFDTLNLKKVLFNLLSNAFKFTPNNGKIAISLSTKILISKKGITSNYLELMVWDNGKKIPRESIKQIFNQFYQMQGDDNIQIGTGIGLALTKNIVKLHRGKIKVESIQDGKSFIVLLPLGKNHLKENQILTKSNENLNSDNLFGLNNQNYLPIDSYSIAQNKDDMEGAIDVSKPSVLIVEDNAEVRNFIKNIFKSNYSVYEAENGQIAIDIASNNPVDIILSDVMMPIMDGIELCTKIKSNLLTSHILVILLTAKTSENAQRTGFNIGADAYLTKPFDATILEIQVKNLLVTRNNLIKKFKKDIILEPKELTTTSADELFLQKAIDLIEKNMTNHDYTINDFISEMNVSRSVLYRKLKALTDQSITEFIKTVKLKRAGQLIIKTQLSISEIAFDLGFNDLKHFRISFQKLFNQLPSQYRSTNQKISDKNTSNDFDEE